MPTEKIPVMDNFVQAQVTVVLAVSEFSVNESAMYIK